MPMLRSTISKLQLTLDPVLNEPYMTAKLWKFSSSEFYNLMSEGKIDKTGLNYIYKKVGEKMTGRISKQEFSSTATEHGLDFEREGVIEFGNKMIADGEMKPGTEVLVQRLIIENEYSCGTPDGLWINSKTETELSVRTIEIKCPYSFDGYIRLFKCESPADVKKIPREGEKYYWQVIHQLSLTNALWGYLVAYQPYFSSGKIKIIKFNSLEDTISADIKRVNERKQQAIKIFEDTIKELTNN